MIKSFQKFNESKTIYFEESEEFFSVQDKHRMSDSVIKDYFTDLVDDGFEIQIVVDMKAQSKIEDVEMGVDGIRLSYLINLSKKVNNPCETAKYNINLKKYSDFIELQSNYIKIFDDCCDRICKSEDLNINTKFILNIPFWGAGGSNKELDDFKLSARFYSYVSTNDLIEAKNKFESTDTPIKKAYDKISKMLKDKGVLEADRLIDTQDVEEHGFIMFGFLTNDEIIVLADFYYENPQTSKDGLVIHYEEIERAVRYYKDGYCSDYL